MNDFRFSPRVHFSVYSLPSPRLHYMVTNYDYYHLTIRYVITALIYTGIFELFQLSNMMGSGTSLQTT